jgi:hypothetical protein
VGEGGEGEGVSGGLGSTKARNIAQRRKVRR